MPPTPPQGWTQLTTSKSKKQCAKLFYHFYSSIQDGLTLHLTDLISLWRCSHSLSDIIATTTEQHTSIDPSESTEQMCVFLEKLAGSLSGGKNKLAQQEPSNQLDNKSLVLKTSVSLPKPLKPLTWTFTLIPQPASELAEQILRPALHQINISRRKLQDLLNVVKEKDLVIEKLLDRVAEKGADMSLIFPTLTGQGKRGGGGVKVEDARRLVPGMKEFESEVWEDKFDERARDGREIGEEAMSLGLEELVKGCEKCFVHSREDHEGLLEKLPGVESLENGNSKNGAGLSQSQSQPVDQADRADTESEDEFETQATPLRFKNKRPFPANDLADTSEDESQHPATKRARTSKMGGFGRRKQDSEPPDNRQEKSSSPSHPPPPACSERRRKSSASTATETTSSSSWEDQNRDSRAPRPGKSRLGGLPKKNITQTPAEAEPAGRSSPPYDSPHATASHASTPSHRLGRIGKARGRTTTASPTPDHVQAEDSRESQSETWTPSRRLGRLGMRNVAGKGHAQSQPDAGEMENEQPSSRTRREPAKETPKEEKKNGAAPSPKDDSDATASSPSPSPSPSPSKPQTRCTAPNATKTRATPIKVTANQAPEKKAEPETEEQKAARRREELKKTIQGGGGKKKRRF